MRSPGASSLALSRYRSKQDAELPFNRVTKTYTKVIGLGKVVPVVDGVHNLVVFPRAVAEEERALKAACELLLSADLVLAGLRYV